MIVISLPLYLWNISVLHLGVTTYLLSWGTEIKWMFLKGNKPDQQQEEVISISAGPSTILCCPRRRQSRKKEQQKGTTRRGTWWNQRLKPSLKDKVLPSRSPKVRGKGFLLLKIALLFLCKRILQPPSWMWKRSYFFSLKPVSMGIRSSRDEDLSIGAWWKASGVTRE